jgi:hypothetical protein
VIGSWAKAAKPRQQWRPGSRALSASKGWGGRDPSVEVASGLESYGGWCAVCGKGPWRLEATRRKPGKVRGVTGSVSGSVIRPASWPNTPRVGFLPTHHSRGVAPNGNEWLESHGWRAWHQPRRHSRSEMPSAAIRRFRGRNRSDLSTSVLGKGRGRKRKSEKRKPSARELVDSTGSRDNKSVADTGKRHLPFSGLTAFRRGRHSGG